jgi:23S rRNA (adenine-N6)-dimethyltransferase
VLDVGAGAGALTEPLLRAGAHVIAVEAHQGRARALADRFGDDIVVVRADAADLRLPTRPFHVVATPPFSVTTALLRRLLHRGSQLVSAHLVLQDQAARRWASSAAPGWNRWSRHHAVELGPVVPRGAFRPAPPVPARVLVLRRRAGPPRRR